MNSFIIKVATRNIMHSPDTSDTGNNIGDNRKIKFKKSEKFLGFWYNSFQ